MYDEKFIEQSRSHWVRYDHYELKTAEDGQTVHHPRQECKAGCLQSAEEVPNIVLDALNVGMLMMGAQAGSRSGKRR